MSALANDDPEPFSWTCKCGGQVGVIDSRPTTFYGSHAIRRRRRCRRCRTAFTTIEMMRENAFIQTLERAQRLIGRSAALSRSLVDLAQSIEEALQVNSEVEDA